MKSRNLMLILAGVFLLLALIGPVSADWTKVGNLNGYAVLSYGQYTGNLYVGTNGGGVWELTGPGTWTKVGSLSGNAASVYSLTTYNGELIAGTNGGGVWAWDGTTWTNVGSLTGNAAKIPSLAVDNANDVLYAGTNGGGVWYWFSGTEWVQVGSLTGNAAKVPSLAVDNANDVLYAGTNGGGVWAWDGTTWTQVGSLPGNAANVPSLSVYNGNLYAGTDAGAWILSQTVKKEPTSVTVTPAPNPSVYGQSVILTATVNPSTATGKVTFKDGKTTLGTGTLSGGIATFSTTKQLKVGSHSITAVYTGDKDNAMSTSPAIIQTVNQALTTVVLSSSMNPSVSGHKVSFMAVITPWDAPGSVTFKDGTTTLGTVTIANGVAIVTTSTLTVGPHSIMATYNGDTNYGTSTTPVIIQMVTAT